MKREVKKINFQELEKIKSTEIEGKRRDLCGHVQRFEEKCMANLAIVRLVLQGQSDAKESITLGWGEEAKIFRLTKTRGKRRGRSQSLKASHPTPIQQRKPRIRLCGVGSLGKKSFMGKGKKACGRPNSGGARGTSIE